MIFFLGCSKILKEKRVAIAIAKNPKLLLCDEPTGALDYKKNKKQKVELKENEICLTDKEVYDYVNIATYFSLKKIDMIESLKSVE